MANRQWHGRDDREPDERELQEHSNYYGQGGWRGSERDERDDRSYYDRWARASDYPRDERWRRDMGRDFSRHEWSPYDRGGEFGFGGTDRGFRGGGYGGYGGGDYRERSMSRREGGFFGPGSGMLDRDTTRRPGGRAPRGYQRSDERIKEDICDRLMHSWIDADAVEIEVKSGEVTLSGTVEDRASKRAIEDIAYDVLGVKDVQNRVRIGEPQAHPQTTQPGTRKPTA